MARSSSSTRTAPKSAPAKRATAKKAAPSKKATPAKKAATTVRGPSKETLAFATKVVKLRDKDGLPWKVVAERVGVPYTANGSSRLRRAYTIGNGQTVGARTAK